MMEWTTGTLLDGAVFVVSFTGDICPEQLMEVMRETTRQPEHTASRGYLVDISKGSLDHLSARELSTFSEDRNRLRESLGDSRITAIYAPTELVYGLARIIAAYDRSPMRVFGDRAEAVAWIEGELLEHPASGTRLN